jgi:hypothetical protein
MNDVEFNSKIPIGNPHLFDKNPDQFKLFDEKPIKPVEREEKRDKKETQI